MQIEYENIPDLSHLSKLIPSHVMANIFLGKGTSVFKYHALIVNVVRLTDLAINEYELARLAFREFASNTENIMMMSYTLSSGHFEYCLDALNRALNQLDKLRILLKQADATKSLKDFIYNDLNKKYKYLIYGDGDKGKKHITEFRNKIQHMEKAINDGEVIKGQSFVLWIPPEANQLEIGSLKMSFDDLRRYLLDLYHLAGKLSSYYES